MGGREGAAYRSPTLQIAKCREWAKREGVAVGRVVQEEDVSGAKRSKDRRLRELIERAEAGVSEGVIVYRMSRFGRNMADTVAQVQRLKEVGARLVAVEEGYDTSQPNGQVLLGVYSGLAEQQLDERRENFQASVEAAVAEGKHIACRAPIGYLRRDQVEPRYDERGRLVRDGRLVVDKAAAKVVTEAFAMRARGSSLADIARHVSEALGRSVSKSSISSMLKNRAYLGEVRGPKKVTKADAHPAIVDKETWSLAQRDAGYHPRDGSLASQALLAGIATCASCGRPLQVMGRSNGKGERLASYVCTAKYNGLDCDAPAICDVRRVDGHVLWLLQEDESGAAAGLSTSEAEAVEARKQLAEAEAELDRFEDPSLITKLGEARWSRAVERASAKVQQARDRLWDFREQDAALAGAEILQFDDRMIAVRMWGEDPETDRRHLRRVLGSVIVSKCDPKRRGWQPIAERVTVRWADGSEPVIASVAAA